MSKFTFGSIGMDKREKRFKSIFDTICDYDDESFYITKKTYHHSEDNGSMDFDYHYVVRVEDLYEISGDKEFKDKFSVELFLIPTKKDFDKGILEKVVKCSGADNSDYIDERDIIDYGLGVRMDYEDVKARKWTSRKLKSKLTTLANCVEHIDSFRGFYLDKAWNRIGTTGWDSLTEILTGKDAFSASLNR